MNTHVDLMLCGNCVSTVKEWTIKHVQENDYVCFNLKIAKSHKKCTCNKDDDWSACLESCRGCKIGICPSELYRCEYIFRTEN